MDGDRELAVLAHPDQWARCVHDATVLLAGGGVGLDWTEPSEPSHGPRWDGAQCLPGEAPSAPACPAGITADAACRIWSTRPLDGTLVAAGDGADDIYAGLHRPTGVAVDGEGRLYVAEAAGGANAVLVASPGSGSSPRRVRVPGRPVDVVSWAGHGVLVLTADGRLFELRVRPRSRSHRVGVDARPLRPPWGLSCYRSARVTVLRARPVVLWTRVEEDPVLAEVEEDPVLAEVDGTPLLTLPGATDVEGTGDGLLVVARQPGRPLRRLRDEDGELVEDEPLAAEGYDGGAVTVDPSGRVVYTTKDGTRGTQGSVARHVRRGTVSTYRLDAGAYRTRWGRVFVEATLPTGTQLLVRAVTSDDDEVDRPVLPAPPTRGIAPIADPEATPPLAPEGTLDVAPLVPVVPRAHEGLRGALDPVRPGAGWHTYETGVDAPPGRYLWLRLELSGTARTSPRVRAVRVERPGHPLLRSLPRNFSADAAQAAFLHGYLTAPEGALHDLDVAAARRDRLVDARTTPSDLLPWLARFAGLVLDQRWPEQARRSLVAEAYTLYARRGTIRALERLLWLYLGRDARVVETWRLRGLGGAVLGLAPVEGRRNAPSVDGNNVRFAGRLGLFTLGGATPGSDSYTASAHRFSVLVPGRLTAEQRAVVNDVVEQHKPSHTLGDVCEIGDGLPVGQARVGYTAYVGPRRTTPAGRVGHTRLDGSHALGTRTPGSRLARTATVGGTRLS